MNKRIRELAREAGIKMSHDETLALGYLDTAHKKFAELLLKETLVKIDEVGYKASNNISTEDTELFKSVLKRHFGVEE
jgi:hypothetical protein